MIEFEILVSGFYSPDQVRIVYDPGQSLVISPEIQQWMDNLWSQKLQQAKERQTLLYESPLFRFVEASDQNGCLHLVLSDTSYKEYVCTRTKEFTDHHSRQELSNALAVCSVIETSDGYILLDKRQGVDVYVGRYHVIGGLFERHLDTINNDNARPDAFAAMRREIREETGVLREDIRDQYCLGVVYDLATPHAELCFLTRLHIPLHEVQQRTPEDNEIKQLQTLQVTPESLSAFIRQHHGNISATGEPDLLLYGRWKFGESWYQDIMHFLQQ